MDLQPPPDTALPDRQRFYQAIARHQLTPLWEVLHALVPSQPQSPCVPAHWPYAAVRPFLLTSGQVISAEEAVRRVLVLENPALRGQSAITQSLYAGLQLILPGEIAPSHRHTQSALRFVIEGQGAYTAVNGERATMHPGDFIITPSWTWHDHGHTGQPGDPVDSSGPVVWLDGLDIPLVRFLDAGFAENGAVRSQDAARPEGTSLARFGHNMAPVRQDAPATLHSPLFSYPYERSREALDTLSRNAPLDLWEGVKLRYVNPVTGGAPVPTMAAYMQLLPAGFSGQPSRQTDGAVYSVVEGEGEATITSPAGAAHRFALLPRDHFVVPSWHTLQLASASGCVLFSFSDRPVQQALGLHREERLP